MKVTTPTAYRPTKRADKPRAKRSQLSGQEKYRLELERYLEDVRRNDATYKLEQYVQEG